MVYIWYIFYNASYQRLILVTVTGSDGVYMVYIYYNASYQRLILVTVTGSDGVYMVYIYIIMLVISA